MSACSASQIYRWVKRRCSCYKKPCMFIDAIDRFRVSKSHSPSSRILFSSSSFSPSFLDTIRLQQASSPSKSLYVLHFSLSLSPQFPPWPAVGDALRLGTSLASLLISPIQANSTISHMHTALRDTVLLDQALYCFPRQTCSEPKHLLRVRHVHVSLTAVQAQWVDRKFPWVDR